jgi:hypothetical protein
VSGEREYANCANCGQARSQRALNERGVCAWCTLTVILYGSNPYLGGKR